MRELKTLRLEQRCSGKLAWDERGGKQRERSRTAEGFKGTVKLKILGIWVVLFVLICDCFVVNLLDQICSLSGWFLVCLEDNNSIFGQLFCLEPMFNRIYQYFCFLVRRIFQIFVILGPPSFHLGALGNCLTRLREGPAMIACSGKLPDTCIQGTKLLE